MADFDLVAQGEGLCGLICDIDGEYFNHVCTRVAGHVDDSGEGDLHQAVQLLGPNAGWVNSAWREDGTVVVCDPQPCPLVLPSAEDQALIDHRVAVVSTVVASLVDSFVQSRTGRYTNDVFRLNSQLFAGYSQADDDRLALEKATEALAVAVAELGSR